MDFIKWLFVELPDHDNIFLLFTGIFLWVFVIMLVVFCFIASLVYSPTLLFVYLLAIVWWLHSIYKKEKQNE